MPIYMYVYIKGIWKYGKALLLTRKKRRWRKQAGLWENEWEFLDMELGKTAKEPGINV